MKINNNNEIAAAVVTTEGAKDVSMMILIGGHVYIRHDDRLFVYDVKA